VVKLRFLYIYCSHIKGTNPINRTCTYFEDMKAKIQEVVNLSKEYKVDKVFHGGDFTDSTNIALHLIDEIIDMIEESGVEWHIIRGNHDEIGHNPEASNRTILDHIFRRCKSIKHLDMIVDDKSKCIVQGFDYYHNIENDLKEKGLFSKSSTKDYKKIAITHAFITKDSFHPDVMHVKMEDIKTDFDLVLIAHYHNRLGMNKIGDTMFAGIGSLARLTIAKGDISRTPSVLYVDTENAVMNEIELLSAKPVDEIFNLERISEIKRYDDSMQKFIDGLESINLQGLNLRGIIEGIGKKNNIEKNVIDKIVNRILEVESVVA